MNWSLAECFQYRTAFWLMQERAVRPLSVRETGKSIAELAG